MSLLRFSRQLEGELVKALGAYTQRGGPILMHPLFTRNSNSGATVMHELCHEWLTINTPYGILFQMLEMRATREPDREQQLQQCLAAQWGTQEGTATYSEMAWLVIHRPAALDMEVSRLPTEFLGGPPYRERFDLIERILPLQLLATKPDGERRIAETYSFVANALGAYALHANVLGRFPDPESLTSIAWSDYLAREAPDLRFERALAVLDSDRQLLGRIMSSMSPETGSVGEAVTLLGEALQDHEMLPPDKFPEVVQEFGLHWSARSTSERPPASVMYPEDWQDLASFPEEGLTEDVLRRQLDGALAGRHHLQWSITMSMEDEIYLATLPYPRGADNESTWKLILQMSDEGAPAIAGIVQPAVLRRAAQQAQGAPVALDFLRESWRLWERIAPTNLGLHVTSECCLDWELSASHLDALLQFRGLRSVGQYRLFRVHGDQFAAVILNPDRLSAYALMSIPGEGASMIFNSLIGSTGLTEYPRSLMELPDWPLLRLRAQSFLP